MRRWASIWAPVAILSVIALAACDSGENSTATNGHAAVVEFRLERAAGRHDSERTAARMQARYRALGAADAVVIAKGDRLLASGSDLVRRLAEKVAARGVLEFRPVLALVAAEQPPLIPADSSPRVLPSRAGANSPVRYAVGPPAVAGGVQGASARNLGGAEEWVVDFSFTRAAKRTFNQLAADSFPKQPPQNSVAIVLDGVVQSAPSFRTPSFSGSVQISGDFTEAEAKAIAAALNTGPYPVAVRLV